MRSVIVRDYAGNAYWPYTGGGANNTQWSYQQVLAANYGFDQYGNYSWDYYSVSIYQYGWEPWTLTIRRVTQSGTTQLAQYIIDEPTTGTVFSSSIRQYDGPNGEGQGIHVRLGSKAYYLRFSYVYSYGREGVGLYSLGYGQQFSDVRVGGIETNPPNMVTGLTAPVSNGVMTANWNATSDDANGIGSIRYEVFRGTQSLGTTAQTTWTMPVQPGESFTFNVKPYDGHRNFQVATGVAVSVPPASTGLVDDSRRVGIHARSVQWGAMGESIDMRSMNVNYTVPLLKAQGRSGLGLGLGLNYNSQNWRKEGTTVTKASADVGYGFGWKLLAGSIIPVFSNPTTLSYYIFTDSTGAEYKLDVNESNVWRGKEGVYIWFDANTYRLYFGDGSFWRMESISGSSEQDAGTRYPTVIQDRNGNQIKVYYRAAIGGSTPNTSARISYIDDVRSTSASGHQTFTFTYNTDAIPHLTGIVNNIGTAESYSLAFSASQALYEPFTNSQQFGNAVRLNSLTQNGVNLTTSFLYSNAVEMTKITLPLGGEMMWNYLTRDYAGGKQMREVQSRDFRKAAGAATVNYAFTHPAGDSALKYHSETTMADPSGVGQRRWSFFTTTDFKQGLSSKYEELDAWVVKTRAENTWIQTNVIYAPYISEVLNTIDVGQSFQKQSKTTQIVNLYGSVGQTTVSVYNNLTTVARSSGCWYSGFDANYTPRYILNVPMGCSATENGITLSAGGWTYDGPNAIYGYPQTLVALPGSARLWVDPASGYRAALTGVNDGYTNRTASHNMAGQPVSSADGQGLSQAVTYGGAGGSMVPTQITPNNNASLGTTMNWNGFLGLTSVSSGNGASSGFGYDAYARPTSSTSADGATTVLAYSVSPAYSSAVVNGRWTVSYYDGVGRPVKTVTGDNTNGTRSTVEMEYEPCACSPMGKVKRVSLPYAPGGTVLWTVYTYDGLGRTLSVAQPNSAGTTTYLYEGNTVRVTSPSGKWKKYEMDSLGRMVLVSEPRPGGGTYMTSYTYNVAGKLVSVLMPRDGPTQTRSFSYDTATQGRLILATNPENGTVSYTYNLDGTTQSKTDAKGIKVEFTYDVYKRVTQMRKSIQMAGTWTEDRCQRTNYFYDENGGWSYGRLTRMRWNWRDDGLGGEVPCDINPQSPGQVMAFTEFYNYNSAGRVTQKTMGFTRGGNGQVGGASLTASWTYNNEGQVVTTTYPSHHEGAFVAAREVKNTYDAMGRLNVVETKLGTVNQQVPGWQSVVSNVQFNAFGAVTSLNHLGVTESRTYNALGQMTRMTKGSLIDLEYRFSATANDGKILSQKNWLTGEDVVYQYDELERLIAASTTAGPQSWGLSWSYDGFGNRLAQSVTQGSGPVNSVLVDASTNRIASAGYSYDSNGNMTLMPKGAGSMTMDYDLSNRLQQVTHSAGAEQYRYAPDNRRVWRSAGKGACSAYKDNDQNFTWFGTGDGVWELITFYSPGGQKMGVYCLLFSPNFMQAGVTASEENVYFGGRLVGKRILSQSGIGNGLVSDFTSDRLQSKGNGSNYYPYGESKTGAAGDDREGFATYTRDEKSGLDYADQRWYASGMGRFTTVDTFNSGRSETSRTSLYSYSTNDPSNFADPYGFDGCKVAGGEMSCSFEVTSRASSLGLLFLANGGAQGSTINSIGPNALEQDIPLAQQTYGGSAPSDRQILLALKGLVAGGGGGLTDCNAHALYVGEIVTRDRITGTNAGGQAINDAMHALTPSSPIGSIVGAFFSNFGETSGAVRLGDNYGRQSGYKSIFQEGDLDQGHHFAFYFQLGYGLTPTTISNVLQNVAIMQAFPVIGEVLQWLSNKGPISNPPDASLGTMAMALGAGVRNGTISPAQAAARIQKDLCK